MTSKTVVLGILSDRPIAYHPDIARVAGGVKPGVFLSQLFYWTGKGKLADGWLFKTAEEMEEETALTRKEQQTARRQLKRRKLIDEKLKGVPATLHFRVNTDELIKRLEILYTGQTGFDESGKPDCTNGTNWIEPKGESIPESTAETTAQTTAEPAAANIQAQETVQQAVEAVEIGAIFTLYESNIGQLTPIISEEIGAIIDDFGAAWCRDAITEAVRSNGRSVKYIKAILNRWQRDGRQPLPEAATTESVPEGTGGLL